ncbi:hypothetical protein C4573_02680 [Candidatus Woesearchaeota archaeon]|nr:MAG: hypothetical protein C4573_02680 [Candidatus Woesearchaeota archaeon]
MELQDLQNIGFAKNEALVYLTLLQTGSVPAAVLVKRLGIHRNIIYDNLEKLIEKGLASFIVEGTRRIFTATTPDNILEYLEQKKDALNKEILLANKIIPQIKLLREGNREQEAQIFRGIKGIKKVLAEVLKAKENWVLGMTNRSTELLGETYWKNYNVKVEANKIKERFLINHDFKDVYNFKHMRNVTARILPQELNQITEIILFNGYVAIFIYSQQPIVFLIKDTNLFETYQGQFEFLWRLSKPK